MTSANANNIDGCGKASYNAETKTLTLNGYSYSGEGYALEYGTYHASIYANEDLEDLTIVLSGTNSVTNTAEDNGNAIYTSKGLSITGSGTLTATATGESCIGIYTAEGSVDIINTTVTASGSSSGISYTTASTFRNSTVEATGQLSNGVYSSGSLLTIDGGKLIAKGGGDGIMVMNGLYVQNGGTVEADGGTNGISTSGNNVTIQDGSKVTAAGGTKAIDSKVINAITGTGWTDKAGTQGKVVIAISSEGQTFEYKKVQFPTVKDTATVTKAPTAKILTYNGEAQELVTAGEAEGGTMQYALDTDDKTAPTTGWSDKLPTATDAGTYYVWYFVAVDDGYDYGEPACVKVIIKEAEPQPEPGVETVDIYGDVKDSNDAPLSAVTVQLKRGYTVLKETVTDGEGKYIFKNVKPVNII